MSESDSGDAELGVLIAAAAESNDAAVAATIIRGGEFIVLQQINMESGDIEVDDEGNFSVVLAEVDDDTAVVCFTTNDAVDNFRVEIAANLPVGRELPAVILDGDSLLDGLPEDCGLLVNPGAESECYFPPGCMDNNT